MFKQMGLLFSFVLALAGCATTQPSNATTTDSRETISPERLLEASNRARDAEEQRAWYDRAHQVQACLLAQAGIDQATGRRCEGARCEELRSQVPSDGCGTVDRPPQSRVASSGGARENAPSQQAAAHAPAMPPGSQAYNTPLMPMGNQMPPQQQVFLGRSNPIAPVTQVQLGPPPDGCQGCIPMRLAVGNEYVVVPFMQGRAVPVQGGVPLQQVDAFGNMLWGAPPQPAAFGYDAWVENTTGGQVAFSFRCFRRVHATGQLVQIRQTTTSYARDSRTAITAVCD